MRTFASDFSWYNSSVELVDIAVPEISAYGSIK